MRKISIFKSLVCFSVLGFLTSSVSLAECAYLSMPELIDSSGTIIEGQVIGREKTYEIVNNSKSEGIQYKVKTLSTLKGKSKKIYTSFSSFEDMMLLEQREYQIGKKYLFFGDYHSVGIGICAQSMPASKDFRSSINSLIKKIQKSQKTSKSPFMIPEFWTCEDMKTPYSILILNSSQTYKAARMAAKKLSKMSGIYFPTSSGQCNSFS